MNLQETLQQIYDSGLTDEAIGKKIGGVKASIVNRLRRGKHKTTSYERGMAIQKLAKSRIKNNKNENKPSS